MEAIIRKRQRRKLGEPNKKMLAFKVRGIEVESRKIERFMKEKGIQDDDAYSHSPAACKFTN